MVQLRTAAARKRVMDCEGRLGEWGVRDLGLTLQDRDNDRAGTLSCNQLAPGLECTLPLTLETRTDVAASPVFTSVYKT